MNYEIVVLDEKTVVGLGARTNNQSPEMGTVIGGLWKNFYSGLYENISGKVNSKALGIYTDYAEDEKGDYTVFVGCEASGAGEQQKECSMCRIPAGKYAKFIVEGPAQQAVAAFWERLWQMQLNRSFVCDFEEYQNDDMEHSVIHMYIGLNE